MSTIPHLLVPVIGSGDTAVNTLEALQRGIGSEHTRHFATIEEAIDVLQTWCEPEVVVPVIVLADEEPEEITSAPEQNTANTNANKPQHRQTRSRDLHIDNATKQLTQVPISAQCGFIIATSAHQLSTLAESIDSAHILAVLSHPVKGEVLTGQVCAQVYRWTRDTHPDEPWAKALIERWKQHGDEDELITQLGHTSEELVPTLLKGIEEVLGPRPRLKLPANVRLTRQGEPVNAIYLVLEGSVSLRQWGGEGNDVLLHHASSGPLIGLMSFTKRSIASFTARTTSPVTVVRMTIEQLHRVLTTRPSLALLLAVTAMRALSDRLVRAEQLHIEKEELSEALEREHDRAVTQARTELQEARDELVEAARFAMLGELAAGIAHELNNPVAAITRAAEHVGGAVEGVFNDVEQLRGARGALDQARSGTQMSTRESRKKVRELSKELGSREMAYRMVTSGIVDTQSAQMLMNNPEAFALIEYAVKIGTAVRDINVASRRIIGLVRSLRSYSRSDVQPVDDVDIHQGLEDTLRLSAPRLREITIERRYDPNLPTIRAFPSRLEQVWTNIIINAAEAMTQATGEPASRIHTLTITTRATDSYVGVAITDNGPGIPEEIREHIFTPHFTTKQGTVHYGLGMGLGIVRQIVDAHSGNIDIESDPQGTTMTVWLPINGPDESAKGEYERQAPTTEGDNS